MEFWQVKMNKIGDSIRMYIDGSWRIFKIVKIEDIDD